MNEPLSRTEFRGAACGAAGAGALAVLLLGLLLGLCGCGGGAAAPAVAPGPAATPPPALIITTTSLPTATSGSGYSAALASTGGTAPVSWKLVSSQLPTGLTLSSSGVISGIPSADGNFNLTVQANDSAPTAATITAPLLLSVNSSALILTQPRVAPALEGSAYTDGDNTDAATATGGAVVAIAGGTGPYTCTLASGALPAGLSLAATTPPIFPAGLCVISGTPSAAGGFPLVVQVADSAQNISSLPVTFTVLSSNLPAFANVTATAVSPTQEAITWTTSVAASSKVCYSIGNDVNTCTPESDTTGVTAHSVTLSNLWPSQSYQFYVQSRGIANGSPQDYLSGTDGPGCCTDGFVAQAAATTGTTMMYADPVGPHSVAPGYGLYVGIYYGPTLGKTGNVDAQFTISGLPPNTKVHWPDEQDNAMLQGTISQTATPDDTITFSGLGGSNTTMFELLTNVGGTTPAGQYTVNISGRVLDGTGTVLSTANSTWGVNVAAPSFTASKAAAFPAIPDKALWETNMTFSWPQGAGNTGLGYWYNGETLQGNCESTADSEGIQYYDGAWVYDQIGIYTNNLATWVTGSNKSPCPTAAAGSGPQGAAASMALYHKYLTDQSYRVQGYWVFPHGLYYACVTGGNAQACTDLHSLTVTDGLLLSNNTGYFDATNVREGSYALGLRRLDYDAGGGSTSLAQIQQLVTHCLGFADAIANGTTGADQPFMDGLLAQALLEYYLDPKTGNQSDPRIPPAIQALADHLWAKDWIPRTGGNGLFVYNRLQEDNGILTTGGGSDLRNLNLMVAPLYAWLYEQTGDTRYLGEGDAIWDSGVTDNIDNGLGWSGKNFSQQYRWSFDYVLWRSQ
ncbi:MAG TPA: putative Ig domain-containing protein [Terriglobales bacterium]|nr:putative Ig domain-containing protein [Terriglobales bacterium]